MFWANSARPYVKGNPVALSDEELATMLRLAL
jgi:hypothetical protein